MGDPQGFCKVNGQGATFAATGETKGIPGVVLINAAVNNEGRFKDVGDREGRIVGLIVGSDAFPKRDVGAAVDRDVVGNGRKLAPHKRDPRKGQGNPEDQNQIVPFGIHSPLLRHK